MSVIAPIHNATRSSSIYLLSLPGIHRRLDLAETLADEEGTINEHPVGGTIDLKVAEEHICAEQGQDLIDTIVGFALGGDVYIESIGG
jgi:hypothetical protein